ncbi:hypothetical protein [Cellulomonas soli]
MSVLVMAVRSSAQEGERPVGDLIEAWRGRGRSAPTVDGPGEAAPVDVSLGEFLRANVEQGEAYLQVDDLAERLQRATEVTRRALPGHTGPGQEAGR